MTEEERQKLLLEMLREQQGIGGAGTDVQPVQGDVSARQQALMTKARQVPLSGQSGIQRISTPTFGGALAKTLAAGVNRYAGEKVRGKELAVLKKTQQAEANKLAKEEAAALARQTEKDEATVRAEQRAIKAAQAAEDLRERTRLRNIEADQMKKDKWAYQQEQDLLNRNEADAQAAIELEEETQSKPLTQTGLQTGLRNLNDRLSPLNDLMARVEHIDNLMRPFSTGGKKEDKGNIPGIGFIEGSRGTMGDITRAVWSGEEGQQIQSAFSELTSEQMREKIGSAQTSIEIQNTLRALGQQDFSNEETAIAAFERFKEILYEDVSLLRSSTHKEVLEDFDGRFAEGRQNPFDRQKEAMGYKHLKRYDQGTGGEKPAVKPQNVDESLWNQLTDDQKRRFLNQQSGP